MTWNDYMNKYEGKFIDSFKSSFIQYSLQSQDFKFKSVNYPQITKTSNNYTVCIDILNTLIVREELTNDAQLLNLKKDMKSFDNNYIEVKVTMNDGCRKSISGINCQNCLCRVNLYRIKPYAEQFLKSIA